MTGGGGEGAGIVGGGTGGERGALVAGETVGVVVSWSVSNVRCDNIWEYHTVSCGLVRPETGGWLSVLKTSSA